MFPRAVGISNLERRRRRRGLTATDLAARMGVSRSWLSKVERGWLAPSDTFKSKAAAALGTAIGELFPQYTFLTVSDAAGVRLLALRERTLVFSTERRANAAVRRLEAALGTVTRRGPAPLGFFATLYGVPEEEVVGSLQIDPPEIGALTERTIPAEKEIARARSGHDA